MFRIRLFAGTAVLALVALAPMAVAAHTDLTSSDPGDGSTVTEAPTEVVLTFEGEISEDSGFTVTGPSGDEVGTGELDLDVAERNVLKGDVGVEETGEYVVAYTLTGDDGDLIEGEVSFSFDPEGTASPGTPNTALPVPSSTNVLVLAGLALMTLAALAMLRRVIRT